MFTESLKGSEESEDEDDDDDIRGRSLNGIGSIELRPDSVGTLGISELSVQSISTDSKTTHDDSDQVY